MWFKTLFENQLFCLHTKMLTQSCDDALFRYLESCNALYWKLFTIWAIILCFYWHYTSVECLLEWDS